MKYINYFIDPNTKRPMSSDEMTLLKAFNQKAGHLVNVEFEKPVPQSILAHKPLFLPVQLIDPSHVLVGLKAHKEDPWLLSKVFDTGSTFGKIEKIQLPEFTSTQGINTRKAGERESIHAPSSF